MMLIDFLLPQR